MTTCLNCGTEFTPPVQRGRAPRHCTDACRLAYARKLTDAKKRAGNLCSSCAVRTPMEGKKTCETCAAKARERMRARSDPSKRFIKGEPRTCDHCSTPFRAMANQAKYCSSKCRKAAGRIAKGMWSREKPHTITCAHCQSEFKATIKTAMYCSHRCKEDARNAQKRKANAEAAAPKPCAHCGTEFTHARQHTKFCSIECRKASTAPKEPQPTACLVCNIPLEQVKRGPPKKYCSTRCAHRAARIREGTLVVGADGELLPRGCEECGTEFKPKNMQRAYCSRACSNKAMKRRKVEQGYCSRCHKVKLPIDYDATICPECLVKRRLEEDAREGRTPEERARLDAIRPLSDWEQRQKSIEKARKDRVYFTNFMNGVGAWRNKWIGNLEDPMPWKNEMPLPKSLTAHRI